MSVTTPSLYQAPRKSDFFSTLAWVRSISPRSSTHEVIEKENARAAIRAMMAVGFMMRASNGESRARVVSGGAPAGP